MMRQFEPSEPRPVGYVYNPVAYNALIRSGQQMQFNYDFMDVHQSQEVLVFYDRVLLAAYLVRREHPDAFIDALRQKTNGVSEANRYKIFRAQIGEKPE